MTDNVSVTPGNGATIATDNISGYHFQRVKVTFGVDGAAADVSATDPLPVTGTLSLGSIAGVSTETTLAALSAKLGSLGQAVMASSAPVVIASNQTAVPVSFTQAALPANQSVNLTQFVGTAADVNSGNKSAGTLRVVLATDQPALTNKLLVTPDSVALPANQSVNQAQVAGTATATNSGVVGAGVQRVVLATDVALPTGANVIGALTANQSVNNAQIAGAATSTGNGVVGTGVQRVAIASDNTAFAVNATLAAGSNTIGALTANQSVNNAQVAGTTTAVNNGTASAGCQRVTIASDNTAITVNSTPPTLTKGTQGSTGVSTQDLKDAGRTTLAMTATFSFAQTAETLLTMTFSSNAAATSTFTSRTITSGKRMRFQSISMTVESLGSGTAPQRAYLRLRANTAGATTTGSPLQGVWACVNSTAIVKSGTSVNYDLPDSMDYLGDGTLTFGLSLETPDWVSSTATAQAKITVIGYEY